MTIFGIKVVWFKKRRSDVALFVAYVLAWPHILARCLLLLFHDQNASVMPQGLGLNMR